MKNGGKIVTVVLCIIIVGLAGFIKKLLGVG